MHFQDRGIAQFLANLLSLPQDIVEHLLVRVIEWVAMEKDHLRIP